MMTMILFSMLLSILMILINSTISKSVKDDREKLSPFECGYDPKSSARMPFSLHFFLIAIIFLIFDVEITILMPMPVLMGLIKMDQWVILSILFIIILIAGTVHEWNEGSLQWSE